MRELNIADENLANIEATTVNRDLSLDERVAEHRRQMNGQPNQYYCMGFKINEYHPKEGKKLVECLKQIFA
jgi:hypothetical protein